MKKHTILLSVLITMAMTFSGCEVVGGIFKAGMIWGIILVLLVIFGIFWLIGRGRK
jgi:hypothetical protein